MIDIKEVQPQIISQEEARSLLDGPSIEHANSEVPSHYQSPTLRMVVVQTACRQCMRETQIIIGQSVSSGGPFELQYSK